MDIPWIVNNQKNNFSFLGEREEMGGRGGEEEREKKEE